MSIPGENAFGTQTSDAVDDRPGHPADQPVDQPELRSRPGVDTRQTTSRSPLGLSLRLVRDLLAADRRSDQSAENAQARTARLLGASLTALRLAAGAILARRREHSWLVPLTKINMPGASAETSGEPHSDIPATLAALAERALEERRLFVLGSGDKSQFGAAMNGEQLGAWAVVPLFDQGAPVGVLLLALRRGGLVRAATIAGLLPGFHLLGALLASGRGGHGAAAHGAGDGALSGEHEMLSLENQELTARLREVEEVARLAAERQSSAAAALRADVESGKARVAELEAGLARDGLEPARPADESEISLRVETACAERDRRIEELEAALQVALERAGMLKEAREGQARDQRWQPSVESVALLPSGHMPDQEELRADLEGPIATLAPFTEEEGSLVDLAGKAAAALEWATRDTGAGPARGSARAEANGSDGDGRPSPDDLGVVRLAVLHLDPDGETCAAVLAAATGAGATLWTGEGEAPSAISTLLVANLFAPELVRVAELATQAPGEVRTLLYCADPDRRTGFLLGPSELLRRPIDPRRAIEQLRRSIAGKLERVLIVSSRLREISVLREFLSAGGTSNSIACDARQAIEVLDIVRNPDAFVIDLTLERGDALFLAEHLRSRSDTERVPIAFLLPAEIDPERLRLESTAVGKEIGSVLLELKRLIAGTAAALDNLVRS